VYRTWLEIDSKALRHNINALRGFLRPETRFMAVVKANAYGHGLREVASIAFGENVRCFGVDNLEDAETLRSMFSEAQIVILGYVMLENLERVVDKNIELVVYNRETVEMLNKAGKKLNKKTKIHLKLETGTSRQGILPADVDNFIDLLRQMGHVELVGLSTHFATAEEVGENKFLAQQLEELNKVEYKIFKAGFLLEHIHCACSAAIPLFPKTHKSLVRVGLALYGLWPAPQIKEIVKNLELQPVLSWKSRIAQIKTIPTGGSIGYGRTETFEKDGKIAIVPVGYFDGYDRGLSSKAEVLVHGKKCRVIGRICMNMMMIDVSVLDEIKIEDEVILIGQARGGEETITAEELAAKAETINYEIVARIRQDLPKIIK
jgi:alanine racemase